MPLVTIPGGFCLTPFSNAVGFQAWPMLYNGSPLTDFLGGVLTTLLGGGATNAQRVQYAMQGAANGNAPTWGQEAVEAGELFYALWKPTAVLVQTLVGAMLGTSYALRRIVDTRLPLVQLQAAADAQQALAQAVGFTEQQVGQEAAARAAGDAATLQAADSYTTTTAQYLTQVMERWFTQAYRDLEGYANALHAQSLGDLRAVEGWAQSTVTDVLGYAEQETAHLTAELQATTTWAREQITLTRAQAQQDATRAAQEAVTGLDKQAATTLAPVWAGTATSVNKAAQQLVVTHPTEADQLTQVATVAPPDIATALLGLTEATKVLAKTATDCALPYCETKNRTATQLRRLNGAGGVGLLLALVAEVAHDPRGAATEAARVVEPVGHAIVTGVSDLLHVAARG